jgi:hypothetical protein
MNVAKHRDGWWIENVPDCDDCGPYDTRAEADADRRGLERFAKHEHKRNFVTCEPPKPKR